MIANGREISQEEVKGDVADGVHGRPSHCSPEELISQWKGI